MMPLVTGRLEAILWTTKTCSNLNSYNYIKKFCFELSFLTFIPALSVGGHNYFTKMAAIKNQLLKHPISLSYLI
jgi:hypothetical protein